MNRRLRKKLHKGEFNYLGFEVSCKFEPTLDDAVVDRLTNELIDFVEAHDLATGGATFSTMMWSYITRWKRGRRIGSDRYRWRQVSCTESDRDLLRDWFVSQPRCRHWRVEPLKGSWSKKR